VEGKGGCFIDFGDARPWEQFVSRHEIGGLDKTEASNRNWLQEPCLPPSKASIDGENKLSVDTDNSYLWGS